MNRATDEFEPREQLIAGLLWYGTWLALAFIAVGLSIELLQHLEAPHLLSLSGFFVVKIGVALFILLPVTRVVLMLFIFLRERDYAFTAISALVLVIIGVGLVAGL
ncbi:MAG: DUF1634 domain-containing protein [Burkholderiales bacterium]